MKPGQFGAKANVRIFDDKAIKKMSKENLIENINTLKASLESRKKEFKYFEKKGGDPDKQVGHAQRITIEETYLKSLEKALKSRK